MTATSTFGLGRRRWSSPQQCYLHCLRTTRSRRQWYTSRYDTVTCSSVKCRCMVARSVAVLPWTATESSWMWLSCDEMSLTMLWTCSATSSVFCSRPALCWHNSTAARCNVPASCRRLASSASDTAITDELRISFGIVLKKLKSHTTVDLLFADLAMLHAWPCLVAADNVTFAG